MVHDVAKAAAALPADPIAPILEADPSRPFVVAQLGQSLDGRIATLTGESKWINRDAALDHLHRLRAAVDAVVVGVGTVAADDPALTVRRVEGRHPARVVIDARCRAPSAAKCLADDGVRRIVVCGHGNESALPAGVERLTVEGGAYGLAPKAIVDRLHALGLEKLLIEGGARTISAFIDAGMVDRLHVLVAPVILGSGKTGLSLAPIARLADALRPATTVYPLADGDVLFDCDLRRSRLE